MAATRLQLLILLIVTVFSGTMTLKADEDYKYALALMKERREYKSAAEKFNDYITANPDSNDTPRALFYMAGCLARLGKDSSAASTFEKLIRLYPHADSDLICQAYAYGADAYFRAGLYKKASELYADLTRIFPNAKQAESSLYWQAECYNRLASASEHNSENQFYKQALSGYALLQQQYPTSRYLPDALTSAGILSYNFKDYQQSSAFFELYNEIDIELEPAREELVTYYSAESLYWLKDYKAAMKRFNKIINNYPTGKFIAESYSGLGWCYYNTGEIAQAAVTFVKAAEKLTTQSAALSSHFDAAAAFEEAGDTENAIKEYRLVVAADSHSKKQAALVRLGILEKDSGNPDITRMLSQAFTPQSADADKNLSLEAGVLLADKNFANGNYNQAVKVFSKIVKIAPGSKYAPYALYQLALANSKLNKYREASTAIKLLLKNYPDTSLRLQAAYAIADYQDILGAKNKSNIAYKWLAQEAEKWAETYIQKQQVNNPEKFRKDAGDIAAASLLRLAESLYKDRDNPKAQAEAKDYFSSYITRYPDNPRLAAALLRLGELTEKDNLQIAHTYFKNAIASAERAAVNATDDPEFSNILMHSRYRLCLNDILLSQQQNDKEKKDRNLDNALKNIESFIRDYQHDKTADDLLAQLKYYKSEAEYTLGNIEAAKAGYEKSFQTDKNSKIADAALFSSAWIDQQQGDTVSASAKLQQLLSTYNNSQYAANALYILAVNYRNQHDLQNAEKYLLQLLSKYPESEFKGKAGIEMAKVLAGQKRYTEAESLLKKLLNSTPEAPEDADTLYTLSWVYWNQLSSPTKDRQQSAETEKLYTAVTATLVELLNKYPDYKYSSLAKFRLGEVAYLQQAYENALSWYRSLTADKSEALADKAHYRIAWCCLQLAKENTEYNQQALNEFKLLCTNYPESTLLAESALRAAKLLRQQQDYQSAFEYYKKAENNSQKTAIIMAARYGQGITSLLLEEYTQSLRLFKAYLQDYPQSPLLHEANWGAGQAALMLGATADAADYFNKAKEKNYNGEAAAKARYGLGLIAMQNNDFKEAREEFRKVDVFHSQWSDIAAESLLKAAEASRKLGENTPAENDLKRILDIYANTPSAQRAEEMLLSEAK